nr:hypothetical protein CFP56_67831 [Quercus suber]
MDKEYRIAQDRVRWRESPPWLVSSLIRGYHFGGWGLGDSGRYYYDHDYKRTEGVVVEDVVVVDHELSDPPPQRRFPATAP